MGIWDSELLITVTYTDDRALDVSSLGDDDIVVTRVWDAFVMPGLTLLSRDTTIDGPACTAVYRLPAPDGVWSTVDNGDYEITLRSDQVNDTGYPDYNYAPPSTPSSTPAR